MRARYRVALTGRRKTCCNDLRVGSGTSTSKGTRLLVDSASACLFYVPNQKNFREWRAGDEAMSRALRDRRRDRDRNRRKESVCVCDREKRNDLRVASSRTPIIRYLLIETP